MKILLSAGTVAMAFALLSRLLMGAWPDTLLIAAAVGGWALSFAVTRLIGSGRNR